MWLPVLQLCPKRPISDSEKLEMSKRNFNKYSFFLFLFDFLITSSNFNWKKIGIYGMKMCDYYNTTTQSKPFLNDCQLLFIVRQWPIIIHWRILCTSIEAECCWLVELQYRESWIAHYSHIYKLHNLYSPLWNCVKSSIKFCIRFYSLCRVSRWLKLNSGRREGTNGWCIALLI